VHTRLVSECCRRGGCGIVVFFPCGLPVGSASFASKSGVSSCTDGARRSRPADESRRGSMASRPSDRIWEQLVTVHKKILHAQGFWMALWETTQRFVPDSLKQRTARFEHAHRRFAELSHIDHGIKLCPLLVDLGDRARSGVQKSSNSMCTDIQWESSAHPALTDSAIVRRSCCQLLMKDHSDSLVLILLRIVLRTVLKPE